MSAILCPLSLQTIFHRGRPEAGAKVLIYRAGTTTPKTVYVDNNLQAAHARPIMTDGDGRIPPIYVGSGDYKLRLLTAGDVVIGEVDGLPGAPFATDAPEPGESYPLADPTAVLITGDIIASYRSGSRAGFARCNGNTIGTAASGASEIAVGVPSSQMQPIGSAYPLFVYLWENDPNLPVYSSGVEVARAGDHQHNFTSMTFSGPGNIGAGSATNNVYESRITAPAGNHAHSFWTDPAGSHGHVATTTIEETGQGQSYSAVPPAMLLTFYIKL